MRYILIIGIMVIVCLEGNGVCIGGNLEVW